MKKILFIFLIVHCTFVIDNCLSQWVQINTGHTNFINDVYFINNLKGWSCDNSGKIYKSTNGGVNFVQVYSSSQFTSIHFMDSLYGFAVGSANVKTTNGGINWTVVSTPAGGSLYTVYVYNSLNIWAAGAYFNQQQAMYLSPDAGSSWTRTFNASNNSGSVWGLCRTQLYFYASGTNGLILRNVGTSAWDLLPSNTTNHLWSVDFGDNNNGWAVGNNGTIRKTTNVGSTWAAQNSGVSTTLYDVYFINANKGWICGVGGLILYTSNGGINWLTQSSGVSNDLNNIYFIDSTTGWACGANGTILKTTTGGITFLNPISSEIPNQFSLSQNYPNPFNPTTNVQFSIINVQYVTLKIFDVLGREVATLVNEQLQPGTYEVDWDGSNFASGIYFYILTADPETSSGFRETKKMVLLR